MAVDPLAIGIVLTLATFVIAPGLSSFSCGDG